MDTLERAKFLIKKANEAEELEGYVATIQEARAMAAIAQAEQLKRIADALTYIRKSGTTVSIVQVLDTLTD